MPFWFCNVFCILLMQASESVKAMQSFREKLPAFKMKSEFLKAVAENQVQCLPCRKLLMVGIYAKLV